MAIQLLASWVDRSLLMNGFLSIMAGLDNIAYTVFSWVMTAVFDIANSEIINSDVYKSFEDRIYIILGIFMLFKVTISLLNYLVNPDKINDKQAGMGKIVTRTIVVIVMLIGLPALFNLLDRAQPILLEALPRIIIGKNTNAGSNSSIAIGDQATNIADSISWSTFQLSLNDTTVSSMGSEGIDTVKEATSVITEPEAADNSKYKYYYLPFIGTVIAVIMTFLMAGICIDVAIRAFKLVILRMIAPIPIISYIDPKSAKDGAFSAWTKALLTTWLDLFTRLGIIYFVLFMIDTIILQGNFSLGNNDFFRNAVVITFLIIGLFFFAKQAPKFIMDILGIKSKGEGFGFGKALTAAAIGAGAIGSGFASAKASYLADEATGNDHNLLRRAKNVGAGLFGAGSGIVTGVGAATSAKDHHARAAMDAMNKRNANALSMGMAGSTLFGRMGNNIQSAFTGQDAYAADQAKISNLESKASANKQLYDYLMDRAIKPGANLKVSGVKRQVGIDASGKAITRDANAMSYSEFNSAYQSAIQNGDARFTVNGEIFETNASTTAAFEGDLKEAVGTEWARANSNDDTLQAYERVAGISSGSYDASGLKKTYKGQERQVYEYKNSATAKRHKANSNNSSKK